MFDEDNDDEEYLDAKFSLWDLCVAFFAFLHGVGMAFANASEILLKATVAASNRELRQADFAEQAGRAIESIPVMGDEA